MNLSLLLAVSVNTIAPNTRVSFDSIAQLDANGTDLNSLMFLEFQEWDAAVTRWVSVNGSLSDPYDRAQAAPGWKNATLSGMGSLIPMISFYEATHDEYYLRKIQFFVDTMIEEPWFKTMSDVGEIYYVPSYWYGGREHDTAGMKTMWFATAAVKLYQWTGLAKYKQLADDVASQSLKLVVVNNATDMAWSWAYYLLRDLKNAKIGVNRQTSVALFYSVYGSVINSTFSAYVPKIVNWVWRSQLASGGLAYSIGVTYEDVSYSAFSLAKALSAYQYASNQFDASLKTRMNSTLMWLRTGIHGGNNFVYNNIYIIASAYILAVKTGFYTPTQSFLDTTKTVIYTALQMVNVREKGHVTTFDDFAFGYRWAEYYNSYFFSTYPLPQNLQTYIQPIFAYEPLTLSRVKLIGAGFQNIYGIRYLYGDLNLMNGMYRQTYITTCVAYKSGTYTRSVTAESGYLKAWANSSSPLLKVLQYWYPSYTTFADVRGNGSPRIVLGVNAIVRVSNGTIYDLSNMSNGTKILSNDFMIFRNTTTLGKETQFIYTPNTNRWSLTRLVSTSSLESTSLANYQITAMGLASWNLFGQNVTKVYNTMKNLVLAHHSVTPVPYNTQISLWKNELNKIEPQATWLDTYKSATNSDVKLIAHSNPEKVLITAWIYAPRRLTLTIDAPSGTNSTTKIFCEGDAKPEVIQVKNGTIVWNYNASTNILTLDVSHDGPAEITVKWKTAGANFVEEITLPSEVGALSVDVDSSGRIFFETTVMVDNNPNDVYMSVDNGAAWTKVLDGVNAGLQEPLLLHVNSQGYIFALQFKKLVPTAYTLKRSIDNGTTWTTSYDNLVDSWHMTETSNGTLILNQYGSNATLLRSDDGGLTWKKFYTPSGVSHVHVVGVDNLDHVWVGSGDGVASKIERYDGASWTTLASGVGTQPAAFWFDDTYAYLGPDGMSDVWRIPLTGTWSQRESVIKLSSTYGASNWVFTGQYYKNQGIYVFGTERGQLWASWDAEHWVKIWESSSLGSVFQVASRIVGNFIYFADRTSGKLYRASLTKEDIIKLYYDQYNVYRGSLSNNANYVLEQRIWNGTTNYLNFASVGLTDVQASIKGLNRANSLNLNSGFEWNNMTGWTRTGNAVDTIDDTTAAHGTKSYKVMKSESDTLLNTLTGPSPSGIITTPKGSLVTLSFWAKANATVPDTFLLYFINGSGGRAIYQGSIYSFTTSWKRYSFTYVNPSTSNYPTIKWMLYFRQKSVTSWIDSVNWYVDQTELMYGATGATYDSISYIANNLTHIPYFEGTLNTLNPSLIVAGQTVSYIGTLTNGTSSSATNLSGILTGAVQVSANIQGSGEAILRITGTRILYEDSIILKGIKDNVYYGRYYGTFTPAITTNETIAITNLQANITSLSYAPKLLTFSVTSPLGTNSTTIIYCGDKGKPNTVLAQNGALLWSYNALTTTLTLQVVHSSSHAEVAVDWRIAGDVNGDGVVDANDLTRINRAYGSNPEKLTWDTQADLNRDNIVSCHDLFILGKHYGNTGP